MSEEKHEGPEGRAGAVRHGIVASAPAISLKPGAGETTLGVYRR